MKLVLSNPKIKFQPIVMTLTIESAKEAEALFELGNLGHAIQKFVKEEYDEDLPIDAVLTPFYQQLEGQF